VLNFLHDVNAMQDSLKQQQQLDIANGAKSSTPPPGWYSHPIL
jgi:hypothetical protein